MTARAIFVSPHLDDAVLSCGGGIARLVRARVPVTVVTVVTTDQAPGTPLSPLARRNHASWAVGDQPFEVRRAEDLAALQLLGADAEHLAMLDAMYRRSPSGAPLYADSLSVPAPDDVGRFLPQLESALRAWGLTTHPEASVFCPAGTGGHVDHVLTRQAVERIAKPDSIVYYKEYPYLARPGASATTADDPESWPPRTLALSPEELQARIDAIACYASQLRGLFPSRSERLREIAAARLPIVGQWVVRRPDMEASRERMAARVRQDTWTLGGERYRWSSACPSPFASE